METITTSVRRHVLNINKCKRPKTIQNQGQPGILDEPPAGDRSTSLYSSLLPVGTSSHTSGSPQLILCIIKFFSEHLLSFCDVLCQPEGEESSVGPCWASASLTACTGPGEPV